MLPRVITSLIKAIRLQRYDTITVKSETRTTWSANGCIYTLHQTSDGQMIGLNLSLVMNALEVQCKTFALIKKTKKHMDHICSIKQPPTDGACSLITNTDTHSHMVCCVYSLLATDDNTRQQCRRRRQRQQGPCIAILFVALSCFWNNCFPLKLHTESVPHRKHSTAKENTSGDRTAAPPSVPIQLRCFTDR